MNNFYYGNDYNNYDFVVKYGSNQDFMNFIITVLSYNTNPLKKITLYIGQHAPYSSGSGMDYKIGNIIAKLLNYYEPKTRGPGNQDNFSVMFPCDYFYQHFPSARERIKARNNLQEILALLNISLTT